MGTWEVRGPVRGRAKSWRDIDPALAAKVERITAPIGRGIAWEGAEIWAYRDRPRNVVEVFRRNVRDHPDREAYVFHPGGERLTWGEVGEQVDRIAHRLRHDYGFEKRDRLCLLTLGCPAYVVGYLAIAALGGIAVPVNLGLTPEGIAAQIDKVAAKGLLISPEVWESKVESIRGALRTVESVFAIGDNAAPGTIPFASLAARPAPARVEEEIDEWDVLAISFTSGTTGAPKGTMAMHVNAAGCAQAITDAAKGLSLEDVNLCMPPLYHNTAVYTDFMPALFCGGKCVVMSSFNPLEAIELIEREKVTWAVAAPIMLWMMMNHQEFHAHDTSSFEKVLFGGHASSEAFIRQLARDFSLVAMCNGGSVSESTALGFALPTEDALRKITSCGLATPPTEIAVFDDDGNEITEPNAIGEVGYKGQQTNAGYWDAPEKTAEVFRRDGYVLSGDWAKIDEEGYLWLLDRKKDMVVRGGQNVYCIEVENKLYLHEKVLAAAVVGVPDHVFSERLKAVIVPKPGQTITGDEIRAHCAQHLARYEVPEYVVLATAIPTNPAGKTLKRLLVDFWGEAEDAEDAARAKLAAFCSSMPPELLDLDHLRLDGAALTPRAALREMVDGTDRGRKLRLLVAEQGIVELLKPDESRFKTEPVQYAGSEAT
jgi:steroid-24-oyl-CoA synthetase